MGAGVLEIAKDLTMPNRCNFDPRDVHGPTAIFTCPECGIELMSGYPHPVLYDDRIEHDHAILEWIDEHNDSNSDE